MISAVITGAGSSTRFGKNKMLSKIYGRTLIYRTIQKFLINEINEIIITARKQDIEKYEDALNTLIESKKIPIKIVIGGNERIISLLNGVKESKGDIIITHDGARPLVPSSLIISTISAVKEHGAAMTALNPTATVKISDDSMFIKDTIPRINTFIAQTPQGFKRNIILEALEKAIKDEYFVATDDSEIVSKMTGHQIKIVEGDEINIKLTYPSELAIINELYKNQNIKDKDKENGKN